MEHSRERERERERNSPEKDKEFVEKLVKLNRTAKVVKGGRRFSFSALTVIGDRRVKWAMGSAKPMMCPKLSVKA